MVIAMFDMFKKKKPLTPEEEAAKREYEKTFHGNERENAAIALMEGRSYGCNLDMTYRTFAPELSAKIDSIPEHIKAAQYEAMYVECSEHFNALQRRYNKLQEEYTKLSRECGQLEERLKKYEH